MGVEKGHELNDHSHTPPTDILITEWDRGKPAAMDITMTSPLTPAILGESSQMAGAAALAAETGKQLSNGLKCLELGWTCITMSDGLRRSNATGSISICDWPDHTYF